MPFKEHRIRLNKSAGYAPKERAEIQEITGIVNMVKEDANKELPQAEFFTIENQIKAGIDLKEQNTTILNTREKMNATINQMTAEAAKKQQEVNDEN